MFDKERNSTDTKTIHNVANNFSQEIVLNRLRYRIYWPNIAKNITTYIQNYIGYTKWANAIRNIPFKPIVITKPFELIGIDFCGPFESNIQRGFTYILVIVDYFSEYSWAYFTKSTNTDDIIQSMNQFLAAYPTPGTIYFDFGFGNKELRKYFKEKGIFCSNAPAAFYKLIGIVEKTVYIIEQILRKYIVSYYTTFDRAIATIMPGINGRFIDHFGYSPKNILYSIKSTILFDKKK